MKDINIVYVNYLMKEDILKAVSSVLTDILGCPYDVQITVVDNSENKDDIKEDLEKLYPEVKYIDAGGNIGFGKGNNKGFKSTESRYYFAFNMDQTLQDTCYRFDFKSIIVKPFKQINFDKKYNWVKKYTNRLLMKDFDHNTTRPVDWVLGAAMVVRKEVVDEIGWFDDRYFMYLEDCDWCRTMWDNGWPVYYVHDIVIQHRYARASAEIPGVLKALLKNKLARIHLISWFKYILKWRGKFKYYKSI